MKISRSTSQTNTCEKLIVMQEDVWKLSKLPLLARTALMHAWLLASMPFTRWQNILASEAVCAFSPTLIVNHVERVKELSSAQKQDAMTFHWRIILQSLKTYALLIKFSINLNIKISAKYSSPLSSVEFKDNVDSLEVSSWLQSYVLKWLSFENL